jgi:methionyl-tRNA formyltransferase
VKLVFMGSPAFAVPPLEALLQRHEVVLVVTQPDKPAGRGQKLVPPPVKEVAERAGIPVLQPRSARTPEVLEALRATGAELAVVVAYGKILPRAVLEAFPRGCINIHGSILPKYRGAAPVQWAVIHGEAETGVCIMQLDEGMDTGPVLLERRLAIGESETSGELLARLAPVGAAAVVEALDGLAAGTLHPVPQDHSRATMAPMLDKADGIVDWNQDARAVAARIRGVDPWPGAATWLEGQPLKLFGARALDDAPGAGEGPPPGSVIAVDGRGLVVACGRGACAIAELQAPARKRMPAKVFVQGRPLPAGTRLGEAPAAAPSGAAPSGAPPSGTAPSGAAPSGAPPSGAAPSGDGPAGAP